MGYVHDVHMQQVIPCTAFHIVTGTWTQAAGTVTGTICMHKAATAETAVVNIPLFVPGNSAALKGSRIATIEVDYEIQVIALTSVTAALNRITTAADTSTIAANAVTVTQDLAASVAAASLAKHKLTVTITTPFWLLNTDYLLLKLSLVAPATSTIDLLDAIVNYTKRL